MLRPIKSSTHTHTHTLTQTKHSAIQFRSSRTTRASRILIKYLQLVENANKPVALAKNTRSHKANTFSGTSMADGVVENADDDGDDRIVGTGIISY